MISALHGASFPVARPYALSTDESVIGAQFYVMAMVEGRVLWNGALPGLTPAQRGEIYRAEIETLARLHQLAPGVTVDVTSLSLETAHMLESGEVDLALGFMPQLDAGFYQQTLFAQRYVCLASVDHPRIQGELTLERFQAEEHAMVISSGTGHGYLERELARQGVTRKVVLRVPNFLGVAFVVEHTDLVVTIPARLGEMLSQHGRFRIYPTPFALPGYTVKQFWHERFHHDPGNRWLRGLIRELLGEAAANARRP